MCCFSADIDFVGDTRIFARGERDGSQYVVYSMAYEAGVELAMILPIPTPPHPPEHAVQFIDLSDYPEFFDDLHDNIPLTRSLSLDSPPSPPLKIHDVGSFEASFVPHQHDFGRLDARFRLPRQVWDALPQYADYGFTVFKLKAGAKKVHPMAFRFQRRRPHELLFPTVHIHHGEVEPIADFDHELYYQADAKTFMHRPNHSLITNDHWLPPAGKYMDIRRAKGIVAPSAPVQMIPLKGDGENVDIVLKAERYE